MMWTFNVCVGARMEGQLAGVSPQGVRFLKPAFFILSSFRDTEEATNWFLYNRCLSSFYSYFPLVLGSRPFMATLRTLLI